MSLIVKGRLFSGFFLLLSAIVILAMIEWARRGRKLSLRRIAALDAIDEAVARATETGRPVLQHGGSDPSGNDTIANFSIMNYIARNCARRGTDYIVAARSTAGLPVIREIVSGAYEAEGKLDIYDEHHIIRFGSPEQFAFASFFMDTVATEKPAFTFMAGGLSGEALTLCESAVLAGSIVISGSSGQLAVLFAASDYFLIAEELYAAGAYLSGDPLQMGSLSGEDYLKILLVVLLALGVVSISLGSRWLLDIFGM